MSPQSAPAKIAGTAGMSPQSAPAKIAGTAKMSPKAVIADRNDNHT
ncbi:hypothetical protein IV498_10990 [Paenarthrobacter sp. Z7-10]|nr:hypothetical protein [Paenarthrobacter sp. Z7-10]MCZ2403695.1 hypothetical protein [Paenarthrobacter sp. Z7-10]